LHRIVWIVMETSVSFYQTTRSNIPEDSHLDTHRRDNLKSQLKWHILYIRCERPKKEERK
jgi:hypothetical protein